MHIEMAYSGNVGRRMKRADRLGASHAVLLGEDELAKGEATVRNLDDGTQTAVALAQLRTHFTGAA